MTQAQALKIILSGENVFLTGPPGSGKSYIIRQLCSILELRGKKVAITASTGVAATLLGGTTIHSWSGLFASGYARNDLKLRLQANICTTDVLIIDEISMIDAPTIERLNDLLRSIRKKDKAFGGLQVILSGDFFQLPPVSRSAYAFESIAWSQLNLKICYLDEQHRQKDDELKLALTALRESRFTLKELKVLLGRRSITPPTDTLKLLTHNSSVDLLNQQMLNHLNGKSVTYNMVIHGDEALLGQLRGLSPAAKTLTLKRKAKVMFTANNFKRGYANGSLGTVKTFQSGLPVVTLENGKQLLVEAYEWKDRQDSDVSVVQLPLKLAWAITIHNSQGMSLNSAAVDLERSFEYGMGYVALSRVKSLDGLYILGLNSRSFQFSAEVLKFDRKIRQLSDRVLASDNLTDDVLSELLISGVSIKIIGSLYNLSSKVLKQRIRKLFLNTLFIL